MNTWQLKKSIQAIIFDCDSTLSSIEGIDELAKSCGHGEEVARMTSEAMGTTGLNPELYSMRLNLVNPTKQQVIALGHQYAKHVTQDAKAIIQLLHRLKKTVYLVSAGINPAVTIFGSSLGIPEKNIFAVDVLFNEQGEYNSYDVNSPLIYNNGKQKIVSKITALWPNSLYVGDGLNDYSVHQLVTRFIGYGGVAFRENVYNLCEFFIKTPSLSPILPLSLTAEEISFLLPDEMKLQYYGLQAIHARKVKIP